MNIVIVEFSSATQTHRRSTITPQKSRSKAR